MADSILKVEGMSCSHCVKSVQDALSALEGLSACSVSLEKGEVAVTYNADLVKPEKIKETIDDLGFEVKG